PRGEEDREGRGGIYLGNLGADIAAAELVLLRDVEVRGNQPVILVGKAGRHHRVDTVWYCDAVNGCRFNYGCRGRSVLFEDPQVGLGDTAHGVQQGVTGLRGRKERLPGSAGLPRRIVVVVSEDEPLVFLDG